MGPVSGIPPDDSGCGDSANVASVALHLRAGFTEIGTLKDIGFKHGRWLDTVLLQRQLGKELYAAGQSGTRTLRQEKGASPPFGYFSRFPASSTTFSPSSLANAPFAHPEEYPVPLRKGGTDAFPTVSPQSDG